MPQRRDAIQSFLASHFYLETLVQETIKCEKMWLFVKKIKIGEIHVWNSTYRKNQHGLIWNIGYLLNSVK